MADVITVTTGTAGQVGSTAAELINYMSARLLEVAELNTILDQFGDKHPLPSNSSKTIQFTREDKFTVAATPSTLTEGIPPDAIGLKIEQFTATVNQYGALVRLSDLAEITARHDLVGRTIYTLGLMAAETYDQLLFNVMTGTTSTYFPNGRTGVTGLIGTDIVSYVDLTALDALLQANGARPFESGLYAFVCSPYVYNGLLRDPDFKASVQFKAPENIWRGEVGQLGGFRIVRSNAQQFTTGAATQSATGETSVYYQSFAIGRFAYQITDLQNLRVYVVAPGGQADPLQQSRKIGWKFAFNSVITNAAWLYEVYSSGTNSKTN